MALIQPAPSTPADVEANRPLDIPPEAVAEMTRAHSDAPEESMQYGAGFWLDVDKDRVLAMGGGPGVGFLSWSQANSGISASVLCNQTSGAWPTAQRLFELLG